MWWVVLEEQRGTGNSRSWSLSETSSHDDRATAEAEALRLAREYEPFHPGRRSRGRSCGAWAGTS
ncbi:hypothetical protein GCM10027258_66920 [Amycolatopsis stemonae]